MELIHWLDERRLLAPAVIAAFVIFGLVATAWHDFIKPWAKRQGW